MTLDALRGQVVRIVFGPARAMPGVVTIQATSDPRSGEGLCAVVDDAVLRAYAVVTGGTPDGLPGTQILVDGAGWLRTLQRLGVMPGWDDPAALADAVRNIEAHPLAEGQRSHAGMKM